MKLLYNILTNRIALSIFCLCLWMSSNAQIADGKCKFLGNVIAGSTPTDFLTYWNQVTPENAGKWGSVEGTKDAMAWNGLDLAYNFAKTNGLPFKQHTFVWGQQQPAWMTGLTADEQKIQVEEWIKSYCERYPDTDYIDVVNEPLHAVPDYAAALGGGGTSGIDWIVWSFEKARQYCPNAMLALNDYNIINNDGATNNYLAIINILNARGLIDIIGEQGHFMETTPNATIKANLDKLHATGLPIHISEYDVNIADPIEQRDKYTQQFPVLWTHPGVEGITLWGYRQGMIWRENAYIVTSDNAPRPALTWLDSYVASVSGGTFCFPFTDVEEHKERTNIFPNPAVNGAFTLDLGEGNFEVQILDLHGKIKFESKISGSKLVPVKLNEATGVYLLQIFDGKKTRYEKILITN